MQTKKIQFNPIIDVRLIKTIKCINIAFIFSQCKADVITLICHQLWPFTPTSPTIAFHFELMNWYYELLSEGHFASKVFVLAY